MSEVPDVTPAQLKQWLDEGQEVTVIDVRESWELAIMALPFAQHIRMIEIFSRVSEIPRDRPVVIFCRTGSRSVRTVEMLQMRGFTNVYNLDGGILAWAHELDPSMPQFYV